MAMEGSASDPSKELFALAAWLQTFPEFGLQIYNHGNGNGEQSQQQQQQQQQQPDDVERLSSVLDSTEVTLAITKVAEIICGVSIDSALAKSPLKNNTRSGTEMIWTSLLIMSSARARPVQPSGGVGAAAAPDTSAATLADHTKTKLTVLGNLLDCAVQVMDKQERRTYIGRIMGLPKSAQKTIMSMIEKRAAAHKKNRMMQHSSSTKKQPPPPPPPQLLKTPANSPTKESATSAAGSAALSIKRSSSSSPQRSPQRSSPPKTPNATAAATAATNSSPQKQQPMGLLMFQPPQQTSIPQQQMARMGCGASGSLVDDDDDDEVNEPPVAMSSPMYHTTPLINKSALKKSPNRNGHSVAFQDDLISSPPERRRQSFPLASPQTFLSPGTLESPNRLTALVASLQRKTDLMQKSLGNYQQREEEFKQKIESMETEHRQTMIKVEAKSLDRIQDVQRESDERMQELQTQLSTAQEQARKGVASLHELKAAKEELEVMNHSKAALHETTEKLRKYKDKVTELQDVKEALRNEQAAHGQSVDEIVRLENEVQMLVPIKRQVEDYKIRAIEAEVKLVECQDYLRRMEQQNSDQTAANEHLYKGAVMQKDQLEEMQRRIQQDTQETLDQQAAASVVNGVGDGINEINPQLKEELVRLRNENLQLRAFQAKRTEDAVQHLEDSLQDTKQLAERFRDEFLSANESLGEARATINEAEVREEDLKVEVQQWQTRSNESSKRCDALKSQLTLCEEQLEQTKSSLNEAEQHNAKLRQDVQEWMQKKQTVEKTSSERMEQLQQTLQTLEQTKAILRSSEAAVYDLQGDKENLEASIEESNQSLAKQQGILKKTEWELDESRKKTAEKANLIAELENHVKKLQKQQSALEESLSSERDQRKEEVEQAQEALETTRSVLEAKNTKELEELQANMNNLLEDERKAYRVKDNESSRLLRCLEEEWQGKYKELQDRSTSTLQHSRQEAQDRIDFIKKEYEEELAKLKSENSDSQDNMVRRGRKLMEEAKEAATEEIRRLDNELRDLEEKNDRVCNEKNELDRMLRAKLASMKQQLEFSTSQVNDRTNEADEYLDQIKVLEREKYKLSEENEQYRRQLGGRYGADGKFQSQLEKLQKEYAAVVDENRNLKKEQSFSNQRGLASISEFGDGDDNDSGSYRRGGGVDRRALTQVRKEYEEQIELLNDEKRDLIMKMSSQSTDVHKAEKRAWEREEEIAQLKATTISLKLRLERMAFAREQANESTDDAMSENRSPEQDSSFHSAQGGGAMSPSPVRGGGGGAMSPSPVRGGEVGAMSPSPVRGGDLSPAGLPRTSSSPGIDRAKKAKAAQESLLLNRFSSLTGRQQTPPTRKAKLGDADAPESHISTDFESRVLSSNYQTRPPNSTDSSSADASPPGSASKQVRSDVYRLRTIEERATHASNMSIVEATKMQFEPDDAEYDGAQECKQS